MLRNVFPLRARSLFGHAAQKAASVRHLFRCSVAYGLSGGAEAHWHHERHLSCWSEPETQNCLFRAARGRSVSIHYIRIFYFFTFISYLAIREVRFTFEVLA